MARSTGWSWFTLAALLALPALGQRMGSTTDVVCGAQFSWMKNSMGVSPCLLAATLSGACSAGNWFVPLLHGGSYSPPGKNASYCTCSWAVYNFLGACTACQGSSLIDTWSYYSDGCGSYETNVYFPTNEATLPTGTLIPYWAARDPTTWEAGRFNVDQAKSLDDQGHPDIDPKKKKKKSSPAGAIAGGVIGGVVAVVIIIGVFFWIRRRRRLNGKREALRDSSSQASKPILHGRSMSETSQSVDPRNFSSDFAQSSSPFSGFTTINTTSPTMRTHVTPSISTLPYDLSLIDGSALGSPSPPPPQMIPPMSPGMGLPATNEEDVIVPFMQSPSGHPDASSASRKRADGNAYPVYDEPTAGHSQEASARRRLNPPAYSESADRDGGEMSISHSLAQSVDQKRRPHARQFSQDTQTSTTTNAWDAASLRTHVPAGSVSGLDEALSQIGIGAGSTMIGNDGVGARRANVPAADGSVIDAHDVA
ncbi:hypothetical protein AX17_006333 [Amanita inopinata Kibby_2008]|nr:hypothetical protein AX17_006333 [Amanita inopinata Kibby_2008]